MMRETDLYAYSLRNLEPGWSWHVYDVEGLVVASGVASTQADATAAVTRFMARREFAPPPPQYLRPTG